MLLLFLINLVNPFFFSVSPIPLNIRAGEVGGRPPLIYLFIIFLVGGGVSPPHSPSVTLFENLIGPSLLSEVRCFVRLRTEQNKGKIANNL